MKKLRKIFVIFAIMLMSFGGIMFGCADKYKNMKIETDLSSDTIELFLGDDLLETQPSTITFNVSVVGVSGDISTKVKYNLNGNNIVTVSTKNEDGKTAVTLNALNLGQTTLKLLTEEGGKTYSLNVKVTNPLKKMEINTESNYKPYAIVGQTTNINTSSVISFLPSSTTQKNVKYTMAAPYQGVTLLENGTIITDSSAENGSFYVNVQSADNTSISLEEPLQVYVLKPIEDISVMYGDMVLEQNEELKFATNMEEEKHKSLTMSAIPNEHPYTLNVRILNSNGVESINIFSSTLINQTLTEDLYLISAISDGVAYLKITASLNGFEYVSQPKVIKLVAVEVPSSIEVVSKFNEDEITIYDSYKNNYGEQIFVNVGSVNAKNRNFVLQIAKSDVEKVQFFTGKRDNLGNLIPVNFETETEDEYVKSTDILQSGTSLYVIANSSKILTNYVSRVNVRFIASGSMDLLGAPIYKDVTFALRKGVTQLSLENVLKTDELLVPIKQSNDEQGTKLIIGTNSSEHSKTIFTTFDDSGLLLDSNEVSYENSVIVDTRQYIFTLWGAKEGLYSLTFYSQNGKFLDVKVRVFTKVTDITLTTTTIQQNSNIAEINYTKTDNLTTLDGGSLTIKNGSYVNLFINTYNNSILQKCNLKGYPKYVEYDTSVVVIDISNRIHAIKVGTTNVKVKIYVYDSEAEGNIKEFEINFIIKVEELLQNISLNETNITIYEKETLSDYIDETGLTNKQKYGEFTLELKVSPEKLENLSIIPSWTGDVASLNSSNILEYDEISKTYKVKIWCDKLDGFKTEAKVKFTVSVSQYQRTLVKQASINILKAEKVTNVFNIKKVQNNIETSIPKKVNVMPTVNVSGIINGYEQNEYLYLYFDSRNMDKNTTFTLNCDIIPENALNKNLVILTEEFAEYPNVLTVSNGVIKVQNSGVAKLYICTQDSYDASKGAQNDAQSYNDPRVIVVKVADGETRYTALDVSTASDLISINNNIESLSKHYIVTQDITIPYGNWTPIGYINGVVHEFTGSFNGLISSSYNQKVIASISGISFKSNAYVNGENYLGLFAIIGNNAIIENIDLQISSITVEQKNEEIVTYFGGICSKNNGIIQNVYVNYINSGKVFENDANISDYSTELYLGGLVGKNEDGGEVYNCFSSGYIHVEVSTRNSKYNIGGIVGHNTGVINGNTTFFNVTEFNDEYNSDISIIVNQILSTDKTIGVGGIAGYNSNEIRNASFTGYIKAVKNVGGIAGFSAGKLNNVFSAGYLFGAENVGGLIGNLKGAETNHAELTNSSVNMFDDGNLNACIIGKINVGGLVGYAQFVKIENAYARSYKNEKEGFIGDIFVNNDAESQIVYVGGVIGNAKNCNLQKVYARLAINAINAIAGGLIGHADSVDLKNTYERNSLINETNLQGLIIGENSLETAAQSSSDYFYGVHDTPLCGTEGKLVSINTNNFSDWQSAGVLTKNNNKNDWSPEHNWYLPYNELYPYIIFGNKEVLTVEAPTNIELIKKSGDELIDELFIKLENVYSQNDNLPIDNAYVLFKNGNDTYRFSDLFDVNVLPNDSILNVSKSFRIVSSNENVIQVSGKTNANFKLKPVSEGKTTLTIISNLNAEINVEIVIYVVNVVKDFVIKSDNNNLIVGVSEEIKNTVAPNFSNNANFFIKFSKEDAADQIYLNNPQYIAQLEYVFINSEKIFVGATKSGKYKLTYEHFVELELFDENGDYIQIGLPNIKGRNNIIYGGTLEYNFVYGIDDFVCDTAKLQTGLNDSANIVYTLTGDDLRFIDNETKMLPSITATFNNDENKYCWNLQLIKANVYNSSEQTEPNNVIYFTLDNNNSENSKYICDGNKYRLDGINDFRDTIVKIEYVFRVVINSNNAEEYFEEYFKENKEVDEIQCNLICETQIANIDNNETSIYTHKFKRTLNQPELSIVRQKVDTVLFDYYANAEKTVDSDNKEVYEINEMPSDGIIAGVEGILKIFIGPQNAEVNEIEISYSNPAYNLSMRQMLKYVSVDGDTERTTYIQRKPYAIAINNGKGLSLYKESNYETNEDNEPFYSYDGYIYVACLIPSSVPSGQKFAIDVTVTFNNKYKLTRHKELVSKLASQIAIKYDFGAQTLDKFAYVAKGVEYDFYVDFTEIIEESDINNLSSVFDPRSIFKINTTPTDSDSYSITLNRIEAPTLSRQYYRVHYKINTIADLTIQAMKQKQDNNIIIDVQSNQFEFKCVPYVVKGIKIVDGGNNTLVIKQSSPSKLKVELDFEYDEKLKESTEPSAIAELDKIVKAKTNLENTISNNISYWFGMKQDEYVYTTLSGDALYTNYNVLQNVQSFTIGVKQLNSTAVIYVEVPFNYAKEQVGYDKILSDDNDDVSKSITQNGVGLYNNGTLDNPRYIHYLRDNVTLNLTSDVSDEFAIPIRNQEEFEAMTNGVDQTAYYALDNDIELINYTPRDLTNVSFNGNMHTINIKNFDIVESADGDTITYRSNYGLFKSIDENSVVKNLNVNYSGLVNIEGQSSSDTDSDDKGYLLFTTGFNTTAINFGGVVVDNYGVIYNVSVTSKPATFIKADASTQAGRKIKVNGQDEYVDYINFTSQINKQLSFTNDISSSVQIGGIAANNSGYISYSQSYVPLKTNCGTIAGLVAVNSKKISNSKVILNGEINNTLTTSTNAVTGGFVARNTGEIFGCYISNETQSYAYGKSPCEGIVKANASVGGFVNNNTGIIKNCYSNIEVQSSLRSSGFVFNNSGEIESCYSSSKIELNSSAHSPFTGRGATGEFQNTGIIDDCYYIGVNSAYENIELATQIAYDASGSSSSIQKYHFAKFVFATDKDSYDGNWIFAKENGINIPKLIDADLNIYSCEKYCGVSSSSDNPHYNWEFLTAPSDASAEEERTIYDNPLFGEKSGLSSSTRINPRIIHNLKTWQDYIHDDGSDSTLEHCFVIVKDITASNLTAPNTSELTFSGTMFGSNMKISNLYLAADATNKNQSFGLFKEVSGNANQKALVKDLNLAVKKALANNINCVGVFAGFVNNANVLNIDIDASDVVVQGKTMVGAFAGIVNNSNITKVNIAANVNAGRKVYEPQMYNYLDDDLDDDLSTLTENGKDDTDIKYSYAGGFAGAILGGSNVKLVNITGNSVVIGYYVGSVVGLVGNGSTLTLASTKVVMDQYVRGYYIAGGLVGENRGILDRCFIENVEQQAIDANISNTYVTNRNLTFFDESISYSKFIGGLVGFNNGGKVLNSYSKIDVRSTNYTTKTSGGLIGLDVGGEVNSCYATGSVINRYSIGGIIGIVTNKFFLLGYLGVETNVSRADSDKFFASNYSADSTKLNKKMEGERAAYIYSSSDESDGSLTDKGKANLLIKNTLASNKWIVNFDETYLSYSTGMFIGNILADANSNEIKDCFHSDMLYQENEPDSITGEVHEKNSFKITLNNYVNTQILKSGSLVTPANIKPNSIITAILESDEWKDRSIIGIELIRKLEIHTINSISGSISGSSEVSDKIAQFVINDKTLISFENILNFDDLLFHSGEYQVAEDVDEGNFGSYRDDLYVLSAGGLTYKPAENYYVELDFIPDLASEEAEWNRLLKSGLYQKLEDGTYEPLNNNASYWKQVGEDEDPQYYKDNDGNYKTYDPNINPDYIYYPVEISYGQFDSQQTPLYYKDNNGSYISADDTDYYTNIESVDGISGSEIYIFVGNNTYRTVQKDNLDLDNIEYDVNDDAFIKINATTSELFNQLKTRLYTRAVEVYYESVGSSPYQEGNTYYLKFEDDNDNSVFYKRTHSQYYKQSELFNKQFDVLYIVPTFYKKTKSLYEGYDTKYFILPDSEVSSTRFYPEIITNVNTDNDNSTSTTNSGTNSGE